MDFFCGCTGTYIVDHGFKHITEIPKEAAVEWVKSSYPGVDMGCKVAAKYLTTDGDIDTDASINGWMNKLFIIVGNEHGKWIALVKWDDKFSLWVER